MNLNQAIENANSVLDEERTLPTVIYIDPVANWLEDVRKKGKDASLPPEAAIAMKDREKSDSEPRFTLYHERGMRPRFVHESPHQP